MNFNVDFKVAPQRVDGRLPGYLKVSCQKAAVCRSSSKRKYSFVCGSSFSHDDRVRSCVEYCRLCRGERGGR